MADPATGGSLHDLALQSEKDLEQLATGLASAGAPEELTKAVGQMADVMRKIVSALGQGQENTGDSEPPGPPKTFDEASNQMMADHKANQPQ